jgi:hypothetical protein
MELAVGEADGDHQHDDRRRDPEREAERAAAGQRQHGEHRFGSVGDRREGVRREDRQRNRLAHPLVSHGAAGQRRAQHHPTPRRCRAPQPRGPDPGLRGGHDLRQVSGLAEDDRREAATAPRLQRVWKPMQTRIDRQRTHPRSPRPQHPPPVASHPAQDRKLLLVQAGDRGPRTDVGHLLGGDPLARAVAVSAGS